MRFQFHPTLFSFVPSISAFRPSQRGPTIKKIQSRSRFSISIEMFTPARRCHSRRLDFPTKKNRAAGWVARSKMFILARTFQSRSKSRIFVCSLGPLGNQSFPSALSGLFTPPFFPRFSPLFPFSGLAHSPTTSPLFTSPLYPPLFWTPLNCDLGTPLILARFSDNP